MLPLSSSPDIIIPKSWPKNIKSVVLHAISLAHYAITYARGWAANSINARVRLQAKLNTAIEEIAKLREELRIKDARMARIDPLKRPHYPAVERMAILELKAARGWSLSQTAKAFLVTPATIASWLKRIDEGSFSALVRMPEPVNKFPDFVRYIVQRLRTICPTMGKVKIAQTLARAGLHLGSSTVGRILKEGSVLHEPPPVAKDGDSIAADVGQAIRVVTAKYPNHVWHVDITAVPIVSGFWATWSPFAFPQCWPFCWWVGVVVDHFSRRVMGISVWEAPPSSLQMRHFLGQSIARTGRSPKYIICDKGPQFWNDDFKEWCRHKHIFPRFGAVGQHGSIAVVERFILTLKDGYTRLTLIPPGKDVLRRELPFFVCWYNEHRPHTVLCGKTPHEVYYRLVGANKILRFEPRPRWPVRSRCASPQAAFRGKLGTRFVLDVRSLAGRKHLPIVRLRVAA